MKRKQLTLFDADRITFDESVELTVQSMNLYGHLYDHWVFAWSGGKDSTTLVTLIISLIESGQIQEPKSITVLYADTRLEFLPLYASSLQIMNQLKQRGIEVKVVLPEIDKRFMVYMLGRGVPPPNNMTLRWCTRQIKIDPMTKEIEKLFKQHGKKMLLLTGVRQGESAIRDGRIKMSCSKDGTECGQGWYQTMKNDEMCAKLAPLLHWRVCGIWDWLKIFAPMKKYGAWHTEILADAYGGEEAEEINARTGCIGCPLASKDTALDTTLQLFPKEWGYLFPLKKLRSLYEFLREPENRLRKHFLQLKKDGSPQKNQNRMGPLTMKAREFGLETVMRIQDEINQEAEKLKRPKIDLINIYEHSRIRQLWKENTWPNGWTGEESRADLPFDQIQLGKYKQLEIHE